MPKFPGGYTAKTTPVDNDKVLIADSAASDAIKSVTIVNLVKNRIVAVLQTVTTWITSAMIANLAVISSKIDFDTFSGTTTQWRAWTPTLTNFTGTVNVARYTRIGKFVFFYIKVTQGATVTGNHTFSLPIAVGANQAVLAPLNPINTTGYIQDLGTAQYPAHIQLLSSSTCGLLVTNAATTYTQPTATSPTIPMTWANAQDSFMVSGWYEID